MNYSVTVALNDKAKFELSGHRDCTALNPKQLVLYSAAMCAALTTQHLLHKERISIKNLEICVSGELSTPTLMPESVFNSFMVCYKAECKKIEEQSRVSEAIGKTQKSDCGLIQMLKKIAPVSHEISVVSSEA